MSASMIPGERPSVLSTIVAGIDFSETGLNALVESLRLAAERPRAALHVVHIARGAGEAIEIDLPKGIQVLSPDQAVQELEAHVEDARVQAMKHGEPIEADRVRVHIRVGDPADELKQIAKDLDANVIVVGTHGRTGLRRLLLGSVAESVANGAPCAVLVVRERTYDADEKA